MIIASGYNVYPRGVEEVLYNIQRCWKPQWLARQMITAAKR